MTDRPIAPNEVNFGVKVVDIGDIRVARGKTRVPSQACPHRNVSYDDAERRVYCLDCESDIEAFDAFMILVNEHHHAWKAINRKQKEIDAALTYNLRSRAAKKMDEHWRKRSTAPNCPHCKEALLPEDINDTRLSASSASLVRRKRQRE